MARPGRLWRFLQAKTWNGKCNDDGSCLSGRLAATSDPNSFDLLDDDGADCGSVHLSYASRDGMDGILYVSHETGDFKMRRTNRVPAFIEE